MRHTSQTLHDPRSRVGHMGLALLAALLLELSAPLSALRIELYHSNLPLIMR